MLSQWNPVKDAYNKFVSFFTNPNPAIKSIVGKILKA